MLADRYNRLGSTGVTVLVQAHFKECELTTSGKRNGAGTRRVVSVGFHSLRHTAVTLMREAGAVQSISQAIVGHNSAEVHALYTHADPEAMRRAVATLPAVRVVALSPLLAPAMPASMATLPAINRRVLSAFSSCRATASS